jgi:methionine-rich copper-binding protein CopC
MRIRNSSIALRLAATLVLLMGSMFVATTAVAHVQVTKTSPNKGATACTTKKEVRVAFNKPINRGSLVVTRLADGVKVSRGRGLALTRRIIAELKPNQLLVGRYRANWETVARDGHRQRGRFGFRLRDCTPEPPEPEPALNLVGSNPLGHRGMNAGLAVFGDYAYIGSRTDGKEDNVNNAGVMIVDVSDPTDPTIVNQIGPPLEGNPQESSRELRIWNSQEILVVLHTNCGGQGAHNCQTPSINNFRFYDISGDNAVDPQLILQFDENTHEFFLWEDPEDPERAFIFGGNAGRTVDIWDISPVLDAQQPIELYSGPHGFSGVPPNDVTVDPPSSAAGTYQAAGASFGPEPSDDGITGDIVLVNDGSANPTEGCGPLVGFPADAVALVDRGTCGFTQKASNAQAAGAAAMIVANNEPGPPFNMGGNDPSITIPSVMISQDDGNTIKGGLPAAGAVARSDRSPIPSGGIHSFSVNNEGTRAYYALLTGGFGVVDVSDFTTGVPEPELRLVTVNENRPMWPGPGTHSAVKLWNKDWVYVSDEVYGTATAPGHGCPWGWARMIDISDPTTPTVEAEYKVPQNEEDLCGAHEPRPRTSYSAHNPTQTPNTVITTWHSSGVQMIDVSDPAQPEKLTEFMPEPLDFVHAEDPRLSSDPDTGMGEKVVMWSYPVIQDGLIYVVDLRNGLYILEYEGTFEDEISEITFLEGNSNQGHALCYEPVGPAPEYC